MGFSDRATSAQLNLTGAVSALTYGYLSHMNNVGIDPITIPNDDIQIDKNNIGNPDIGTETLRGIIHGYQVAFNSQLISDDTVCDPKYIPCNCIMKDKNGYIQYGAGDELYLDYPINNSNVLGFPNWTEGTISSTSRNWLSVCYGNGKFVTVAYNNNYFAYSTDGINWTEGTISSTNRNWRSVCYGNDKFVTVAYSSNYFAYGNPISLDNFTQLTYIPDVTWDDVTNKPTTFDGLGITDSISNTEVDTLVSNLPTPATSAQTAVDNLSTKYSILTTELIVKNHKIETDIDDSDQKLNTLYNILTIPDEIVTTLKSLMT